MPREKHNCQCWDRFWKNTIDGYTSSHKPRGHQRHHIISKAFTNYTGRRTSPLLDQTACDQPGYPTILQRQQGISLQILPGLLTPSLLMSQMLKNGAYNAIVVSPEQFFLDPGSGTAPRFLNFLRTYPSFFQSIKHLFTDEGHEVFFSGIERHGIPAFRPSQVC